MAKNTRQDILRVRLYDRMVVHHNPANWNWRAQIPNYHNLWISLTGGGVLEADGSSVPFTRGTGILLLPGQNVSAEKYTSEEFINISLHFRVNIDSELRPYSNRPVQLRHLGLIHEIAMFLHEGAENLEKEEADSWAEKMISLFLLDSRSTPEDPADNQIRLQIQRIKQRPFGEVSVESLAKEVGMSVAQYRRRFKKIAKTQPRSLFIHHRIEAAKRLLRESSLLIDEIASSLGYRDTPFFSRQFKQKVGISPNTFRARKEDHRYT